MVNIDQYVLLFIQDKTEEIELFKNYIKTSNSSKKEISQNEWEVLYLNWAVTQEGSIRKIGRMPKIYLSED